MYKNKNMKYFFIIISVVVVIGIFVLVNDNLLKEKSVAKEENQAIEATEEINVEESTINDITANAVEQNYKLDELEEEIIKKSSVLEQVKEEGKIQKQETKTIGNDLSIEHEPEHSGNFVIINSVGYEKFTFDPYRANIYIDSINYYRDNLEDDVKLYNMIFPTSSEFNLPGGYRNLSGFQKEAIDYVCENFNSEIVCVDAYSNMENNKDEYLYFKTDHHWTALGAYRAYESFIISKNEQPVSLDNYKKVDSNSKYLGSIYNMTENLRLENNLDDFWYYKPFLPVYYSCTNRDETSWSANQIIFPSYLEKPRKYSAFMGGDFAYSKILVESEKDNKILIIKDSYGNALIPFLLPHYKEIHIADPRYFHKNIFDIIKENQIKEVLIMNYATALQLPGFSRMIKDMGYSKVVSGSAIVDNTQ